MTRSQDWSPLAWSDPVPGDPDVVTAAATYYRDVATAIQTAAARLRQLAGTPDDQSQAVAAFKEKAGEVEQGIVKVESRYEGLASALATYGPQLRLAQDASNRALELARQASADAVAARANETYLDDQMQQSTDAFEQLQMRSRVNAFAASAEDADRQLASARTQLDQAIADRDSAAEQASAAIADVDATSPIRDTWQEKVQSWATGAWDALTTIIEAIDSFLTKYSFLLLILQVVLTVALLVIPGGLLIAGIARGVIVGLQVISKIALAVKAVKGITTIVKVAQGRADARALVDVGASLVLALIGGRLAGRAFGGAKSALVSSRVASNAGRQMEHAGRGAAIWAAKNFRSESVVTLTDLLPRVTQAGGHAIRVGVGEMVAVDVAQDLGGRLVESGLDHLDVSLLSGSLGSASPSSVPVPAGSAQ